MLRLILYFNRCWHNLRDRQRAQWVEPRVEWRYDKIAESEDVF